MKLSADKASIFYLMMAKLLYLTRRARPDLATLVSFLTTRVSNSDVDDWKKVKRGLVFILNTIDEKRIIGAKSLGEVYTWIDSAYAVHPNMKSHMGGAISMRFGLVHEKSSK